MHEIIRLIGCITFGIVLIKGETYTLGVLLPYTGSWPVGYTSAGAVKAALNEISLDQHLTKLTELMVDFNFTWEDTECLEEVGLVQLVNMWMKHQVDVFIGEFSVTIYLFLVMNDTFSFIFSDILNIKIFLFYSLATH